MSRMWENGSMIPFFQKHIPKGYIGIWAAAMDTAHLLKQKGFTVTGFDLSGNDRTCQKERKAWPFVLGGKF
ncbi:hypothetical protein MHB50_08400 [Siminovitchia sp. FSL H7-0308]|uniref:Uncharacterized protein n=1 Tax=Siminovitchia thermophila TaxID=1245522 RepID=A0ABS2RCX6_9BACI|nr:hypothetical protein [Siminovitchia thermophila]MBM7716416.1 hypothetical protein [Siminovitchia thermophila]